MMSGGRGPGQGRGWEDSQLGRLVTMFHAPQRTFEVLSRSPTIAAVLVATMLVSTFAGVVAVWTVDAGADASVGRAIAVVVVVVTAPVGVAAGALFMALIFFAAFRVVGHGGTYKSVLSAMLHSWWPPAAVSMILTTVIFWFSRPLNPNEVETLVKTNLAAFLNDPTPAVWAVAGRLDVLAGWGVVLAGIGFASVLGISRRRSFTVVLAFWVTGTVLWLGFVVVGNMIATRFGIPFPFP